jgi:hypothetical protein
MLPRTPNIGALMVPCEGEGEGEGGGEGEGQAGEQYACRMYPFRLWADMYRKEMPHVDKVG